ncbi:CoA-substrate-specific enzyme activase, putative [Humidesulfovibrio mexicanus]|uniref:CoA-substrate-specific enzyme activase, putative n=1 Tax=Humidesulfovibrio mexicanus TaxID=147047 RepID=A0A238Y8U9_9BACT|nr:acyl-CoA dehydratase activase [Humidesulfovibrio mexicanus]SNR67014.1 CoA-substrate-specific enzyme activase, putative [Humidesulfovibrio mexicanus]
MDMSLGLDIGAYAVKLCVLDQNGAARMERYAPHHGRLTETTALLARQALEAFGAEALARGALTGAGAQTLKDCAPWVDDMAALAEGAARLAPQCSCVAAIGAQSAVFLTGVDQRNRSRLRFSLNSSCAAGTGSFLDEQASRIGIAIEDYGERAMAARSFPRIAGRCSVFAKTDITHHQQEGTPVEEVLLGLAHAVARNYRTSVLRKLPMEAPLFFSGGVARNRAVAHALREQLGLAQEDFVTGPRAPLASALGAAALAQKRRLSLDMRKLLEALREQRETRASDGAVLPPLADFGQGDADGRHEIHARDGFTPLKAYLGVDVGSTSTNLVLLDATGAVLDLRYLRTLGDPERAVRTGLAQFEAAHPVGIEVLGVGVTGSGRILIGRLLGADVVRDEITAQARAASALAPGVDTVFEIGGQDSKFIALDQGRVSDFQMNKVCAAGTGSFLEEQAKKLGIGLEDLAGLALASRTPEDLGERCTVFMEARVASRRSQGARLEDIAAGLCYAVARNYLNRVAAGRGGEGPALLQGGLAYNQGVVNAFRALTGRKVVVPHYFSVSGALGAAMLAREEMAPGPSLFRGFRPAASGQGQAENSASGHADAFTRDIAELVFGTERPRPRAGAFTVGVPRALFAFGMFPMFSGFFEELGCALRLSEPSSERTVALAQEYALDETCYPVKLVNGHAAELLESGVDALFFPDLHSVHHPGASARRSFGCAYMQQAFRMVEQAMSLRRRGVRLLAPRIAFSLGGGFLRSEFITMGRQLGFEDGRAAQALGAAMAAHEDFQVRMAKRRDDVLAGLDPGRRTFVLISKIYGVADPLLNLGIPALLAEAGEQVLPFHMLPGADMAAAHPNMYWPFGQHILEAAATCARRPDLHAVLLTHHGCGPDSILGRYVRAIMGDKPYLAVEVDEHRSVVGVQTRVEAFLNSVRTRPAAAIRAVSTNRPHHADLPPLMPRALADLPSGAELLLPNLPPYSRIGQALLTAKGRACRLLPETDARSLSRGRAHTVTNESPALAALLGDVLCALNERPRGADGAAVLFPQCEGAETDGQFSRFLRIALDAEGMDAVAVFSPYLEDLAFPSAQAALELFLCLLAGDLVLAAPPARREAFLERICAAAESGRLDEGLLLALSGEIAKTQSGEPELTLFAVGEPLALFNGRLHDDILARAEAAGARVLRAPLSEALWSFWTQAMGMEGRQDAPLEVLDEMRRIHAAVAAPFGDAGPFLKDLDALPAVEDAEIGLYSGAFGRYRAARAALPGAAAQAVVAVSSMYENTGMTLDILGRGEGGQDRPPVLHLAFDGQGDAAANLKLSAFLNTIVAGRSST